MGNGTSDTKEGGFIPFPPDFLKEGSVTSPLSPPPLSASIHCIIFLLKTSQEISKEKLLIIKGYLKV